MYDAEFSSDNKRLVTAGKYKTAEVWYFPTPILAGLGDAVNHVEFSPDGQHMLVSGMDNYVYVGGVEEGKGLLCLDEGDGVSRPMLYAAFSPDGKRVVAAGQNHTARIWAPQSGISRQFDHSIALKGHSADVFSATFSQDGAEVITASGDGTAKRWNARTGQCLQTLRGQTGALVYAVLSRDKTAALTAGKDGAARLWNLRTGMAVHAFKPANLDRGAGDFAHGYPNTAVFSPDEQHVLCADTDHNAYLWNVRTGRQEAVLGGHIGNVTSACFTKDGVRLVTASMDQTARVWDVQAALKATKMGRPVKPLLVIKVGGGGLHSAGFSPDGLQIIVGCHDGTVKLYPATLQGFAARGNDILRQVPSPANLAFHFKRSPSVLP